MGTRWQRQLAGKSSSILGTEDVLLAKNSFMVVSEPECTCGFHGERLWTWTHGELARRQAELTRSIERLFQYLSEHLVLFA